MSYSTAGSGTSRWRGKWVVSITMISALIIAPVYLSLPLSAQSAITCDVVPDTPTISIAQWNTSSGWKSLRSDSASRSQLVGIKLITNASVPAGDVVHVLENWAQSDVNVTAPAGPWFGFYVPLPSRENRTVQIWVENPSQQAHTIGVMLCTITPVSSTTSTTATSTTAVTPTTVTPTTVTPTTVTPTTTIVTPTTVTPTRTVDRVPLKDALPPAAAQSSQYAALRTAVAFNLDHWGDDVFLSANRDVYKFSWVKSHPTKPSLACVGLHDRYWTYGPDGKAYNTWHPATAFLPSGERCDFGHEHGMDPTQSVLLDDFGGVPPFGYVLEQHHEDAMTHAGGQHRHEDHVGHKVTFSNNWEAAYGNSAGPKPRIYRAGYVCNFISKIHQGAHSDDAFTNNLHEYFIAARCNDAGRVRPIASGDSTFFSAKMMVPFGRPNEFKDMGIGSPGTDDVPAAQGGKKIEIATTQVIGLTGAPLALAAAIGPLADRYPSAPNNREFTSPNSWEWKDFSVTKKADQNALSQIDLWSQIINVESPGRVGLGDAGGIRFGAYYIVKNPSRYYDNNRRAVLRTIDHCYNGQVKANYLYCASAPATKVAFNSPESPFNGTFRAVNFKALRVQNEGGPTSWCTDVFGRSPSNAINSVTGDQTCANPHHILQRASAVDNLADNADPGPNARCHPVHTDVCGVSGSTLNATVGADDGFEPQGLGFELIIDQRTYNALAGDPPRLYGQPKVIFGEN